LFYALHAADVWSTVEGMKYDCVIERNPLLPRVPRRDRLLLHKAIFLSPFGMLFEEDAITNREMIFPMAVVSWAIYSNLKVIDRAKDRCNLR
jgi:hypothetical protein